MNAKRLLTCAFAVAVSLAIFALIAPAPADDAREDPLMKLVPVGVDMVISIDLERILATPIGEDLWRFMSGMPVDPDIMNLLKEHGIEAKDAVRRVVFFLDSMMEDKPEDQQLFGFIIHTSVDPEALKNMLKALAEESGLGFREGTIAGREAYIFELMTNPPDGPTFIRLSTGHILMTPEFMAENILGSIDAGRTLAGQPLEGMETVERDALLWAVYAGGGHVLIESFFFVEGPAEDIFGAVISLGFVDDEKRDMRLNISTKSGSEESAQGLLVLSRQGIAMLPLWLEDYPQIWEKMPAAVESRRIDREVKVTISLDHNLIEELRKLIKTNDAPPATAHSEEAVETLFRIRTWQRVYYAENHTYADNFNALFRDERNYGGFFADLDYFSRENFEIVEGDEDGLLIQWKGEIENTDFKRASLDHHGNITWYKE